MTPDPTRLHDAADALRAIPDHVPVFATVADWLQDAARRAGNPLTTISRIELDHAWRIADAALSERQAQR